jgi:benzoyl-CoA reductase/2-hydroxyglutaryl-CoA dehydratase subunit BcrC/BadD/HgdB
MQLHPNILVVPFRRLSELVEENSGPGVTATKLIRDSIEQLCKELEHFVNSGKANKTKPEKMTTADLRK